MAIGEYCPVISIEELTMKRVPAQLAWLKLAVIPLTLGITACSSSDDGSNETACNNAEKASASYCVEYIAGGAMGEQVGKNTFTLHVNNKADGSAATGLTLGLAPVMRMVSGMIHSTPDEDCVESMSIAGDYVCTVYYVMASEMGDVKMGDWELAVNIGSESVSFEPMVMMAMGDTSVAQLKGVNDMISGMMADENRTYYLFKDGMASTDSFALFIAARESMMSFPPVYPDQAFNAATTYELNVTGVGVEISSDGGTTWLTATNEGNGHWRVTGLGLTAGVANTLQVRLTVNGEIKTTDGNASGQDYQTFTVTP